MGAESSARKGEGGERVKTEREGGRNERPGLFFTTMVLASPACLPIIVVPKRKLH